MALIFLAKLLRAARFFVIYFTSVAMGRGHLQEKKLPLKKSLEFFSGTKNEGGN